MITTHYTINGERLMRPQLLKDYALIIRCIHQRGEDQEHCLEELDRRGLWLTDEQKVEAGLACKWPPLRKHAHKRWKKRRNWRRKKAAMAVTPG